MNGLSKFINNGRTNLRGWQRNLFFATTVFVVLLNIILYGALGSWEIELDFNTRHWHDCLFFTNLIHVFFSAFSHANWQHTLLNMLCFLICGIYIERKTGSVKLILLILCFSFFAGCAVAANNNSIYFHGFSGVNYALYAYILIDYLFCIIPKNTRNKLNVVYGGIMLGLIYFSMCFNGGTQSVGFCWYPYDAMYNLGHYTSYFVGLIIATFLCIVDYRAERSSRPRDDEQPAA